MSDCEEPKIKKNRRERQPEVLSVARQVTMYVYEWKAVEWAAENMGVTRSEFLRRACQNFVPGIFKAK